MPTVPIFFMDDAEFDTLDINIRYALKAIYNEDEKSWSSMDDFYKSVGKLFHPKHPYSSKTIATQVYRKERRKGKGKYPFFSKNSLEELLRNFNDAYKLLENEKKEARFRGWEKHIEYRISNKLYEFDQIPTDRRYNPETEDNKRGLHWPAFTERSVAVLKIVDYEKLSAKEIEDEFLETMMYIRATLDDPEDERIKSVMRSDTIIVLTRDDSDASQLDFVGTLMRVQVSLLEIGVAIKGGISSGMMLADIERMAFFGVPLSEAEAISKSINLYAIGEKCIGQTSTDLDDLKNIGPGLVPLYYPEFIPTNKGLILMNLVNITIICKQLYDMRKMFNGISEKPLYTETLSVFEDAFKFTFPKRV